MATLDAWTGHLKYYGLALLLVAGGVMMRMALTRLAGLGLPTYISFFPFVMLAALIGGWGPGLLATLATVAVVDYWLLPPSGTFKIESMSDAVGLAFFCVMGLFVSVVAELYRRTRDHLDELVVVRTTALSQANEQLLQEVAERRRAEAAVQESEEKYRYIVETATEGIAMADANARIVFANDRWSEIHGYRPEEARHVTLFDLVFPEDVAQMTERWESRKRARTESYEFRFRRKDGSPVWTLIGVAPRFDPEGGFLGTLVMVTDITERKRAEESLREWNATLETKVAQRTAELRHRAEQLQRLTLDMSEAEDRERRRMAEILHDDLQQELAAAKFHLNLVRNRIKDDPSTQALTVQIDQMLKDAIGKSRSLSHELSPAVLHDDDFAETLRWLADEVQTKHGLVVHVYAPGQVHSQSEALKGLLYKTARELLFNVVKHARVGEARIRVRRWGRCIGLLVSDRGRGFDPQELREAAGFGLLSICERIELLGGRMKVRSAPGRGSTFAVAVPEGSPSSQSGSVEEQTAPGRATKPATQDSHARLRVLLADDHQVVREGLAALLNRQEDMEVVGQAAEGREAVDLAQELRPDVVVMDVAMPAMAGDEATRQIKQNLPQTRVVAFSMLDEPDKRETMYQAGAESYVLKTAPFEELFTAIRGKEPES